MEGRYLKRQGLTPADICRLGGISKPTFYRDLHEYCAGGIEKLPEVPWPRRRSQVADDRASIEADLRPRPPARVAAAAARLADLTGLQRGPTPVRQVFKSLGLQLRQVGQMPATADVTAHAAFQTEPLAPRLAAAKAGQRGGFCLAAAHGVFAPFLGLVWCCERLFVKAPSGRPRVHVRAAWPATTRESCTVPQRTYMTAEPVCTLRRVWAGAYPGVRITGVLDTARYQRGALGQSLAQRLGVEWLFLPASWPNLHLMERFWQLVKKQCLYAQYYPDHGGFQPAIIACMTQAPDQHQAEWESLLTLQFPTFHAVRVLGEASNVCLFPVDKKAQKKVSSTAA
jgi:transposase